MKNQEILFHQELTNLAELARQYVDLSGENELIQSLHQQLEPLLSTEPADNSDGVSFVEPGANGTTLTKKTALGSFKIYIVAKNDGPSAIAHKFGFTLNRLTELQHPILRNILKLTQRVSLNNEAYRKMKPEDIVKDFWKDGQGKLWALTLGDQLLIQEPSLDFLKKFKITLFKKRAAHKVAAEKKKEEKEAVGTQIFDRKVNSSHDCHEITTHAKHFMEVTGLFQLLGAINLNFGGRLTFSSKATQAFNKSLIGIKELVGSRNVIESISVDVLEVPSKKVDKYFEGLDYVGKIHRVIEDAIRKAIKNKSKKDKILAEGIKKLINKMLKEEKMKLLPPLGHDFYGTGDNRSIFLPSMRYTSPQLFFINSGQPIHQCDNDTQTLYYKMVAKEMKNVGFKNMKKK
jgi:hypothetical protein